MKILVGINSVHDSETIKKMVDSGVNEFYLGYIPSKWSEVYGWEVCPNRRQYPDHNYETTEKLENIVSIIHSFGKEVSLTFNEHEYTEEQSDIIIEMLNDIKHIPYDSIIVGNFALMLLIREQGIKTPIHLSIATGCNNSEIIKFYTKHIDNITRVVLPRKLTIQEIELLTKNSKELNLEVEVFGFKDPCYYNDENCYTWHSKGVTTFCGAVMTKRRSTNIIAENNKWKEEILNPEIWKEFVQRIDKTEIFLQKNTTEFHKPTNLPENNFINFYKYNKMFMKCGLCCFKKFKEFGVDYIKLPLRSNFAEGFNSNIEALEIAKTIMNHPNADPDFCKSLLDSPSFCTGEFCYYNYPNELNSENLKINNI